jgi:hypothetical protein
METHNKHNNEHSHNYRKFAIMAVLSFVAMYILMYSMVDSFANVLNNVNQVYMAALMTAAMVLIEMIIMWNMYKNRKANAIIITGGTIVLILCFFFIRKQTAVSDKQFLKSMIPHHAAAILMVQETELNDPEIQKLADDIITAQQKEIEFMKTKIKQIENK